MTWETQYLQLAKKILDAGEDRRDRTNVGTRAIFGETLKIDLREGFPLMTTKALGLKSILSELLWFIEGSGDERRLAEILHGTRDPSKKTIWSPNAEHTSGSAFTPSFPGDLGRVYGVQWRKWNKYTVKAHDGSPVDHAGAKTFFDAKVLIEEVDQLSRLIETIKTNPTDRRLILSAWNPGELDRMVLPPCHMFAQFYVSVERKELSCQMYQRSVDVAIGLPYNVASYAALTHMVAHVTGLEVGTLTMCLGDTHIYQSHVSGVQEQLTRTPLEVPQLRLNPAVTDIDRFTLSDFELVGYNHLPRIHFDMAA